MAIYLTSDWHFCHGQPFIYEPRGFKNIDDVLRLVKDEREVMTVMAFGKGGAFESFASIVNDNIPKHENVGLATTAGLEEVINKIAKASGKSQDQGTQVRT